MPLDLNRLDNVVQTTDGWQCACPYCRISGHDKTGHHLKLWKSGHYSCAVAPGDKEHNRGIYQLAGVDSDGVLDYYIEERVEKPTVYFPEDMMKRLVKDYSYWIGRGISVDTISQFEGGLAITDGKMKNRWTFPLRDLYGRIVGWSGRYVKEIPKWSGVPRWKHIGHKSKCIYPKELSISHIRAANELILVESIGDCLACYENGVKNVLVLFGVKMSSALASYVISLGVSRVVIATNNDTITSKHDVGNDAAEEIRDQLLNFFNSEQVVICLPNKKDFGEMNDEDFAGWKKEKENLYLL